jgi:hypothetical protein
VLLIETVAGRADQLNPKPVVAPGFDGGVDHPQAVVSRASAAGSTSHLISRQGVLLGGGELMQRISDRARSIPANR